MAQVPVALYPGCPCPGISLPGGLGSGSTVTGSGKPLPGFSRSGEPGSLRSSWTQMAVCLGTAELGKSRSNRLLPHGAGIITVQAVEAQVALPAGGPASLMFR